MSRPRDVEEGGFANFAFNRKKIRYADLDEILGDHPLDTTVNMFFDMRHVLDVARIAYYADMYAGEFVKDSNRAVAEMLNFVAHYRRYFLEKRNCDFRAVLLFDGGGIDHHKAQVQGYGVAIHEKTAKPTYLGYLGKKAASVCPFLPDVYVVNSGDVELTVSPLVVRDAIPEATYTVFMGGDHFFHQMSKDFLRPIYLYANGQHSKGYGRNEYFRYVFEKEKYAIKGEKDYSIDDSYAPLYAALSGKLGMDPIGGLKSRKAIDAVRRISDASRKLVLSDWREAMGSVELPAEVVETAIERQVCFDAHAHRSVLLMGEEQSIIDQIRNANMVDRHGFKHFNSKYFGNSVDEVSLFAE